MRELFRAFSRFMWRFSDFGIIQLFLIIFISLNILTFALFWLDKRKAIKNRWRIKESTLIFFSLFLGGIGSFSAMHLLRHKNNKRKFKILVPIGLVIAVIPVIHIIHALTLDRIIYFNEITFYSDNWPSNLNGYRIAFITDKHTIQDERMAEVVTELNERNIDLLLLGGDFSRLDNHYRGTLYEISKAITTDGIAGVEGNHDNHISLFARKEKLGIVALDNSGIRIREGFFLAGVQDMWNRNPNIEEAIRDAENDDFILLISHNPDVSMRQNTQNINLMLSGHTHGGQITFFGWPFFLHFRNITAYGTRFAHGFAYSKDNTPVFTSSGVGVYYGWPRAFNRPEVVIFTMSRQP